MLDATTALQGLDPADRAILEELVAVESEILTTIERSGVGTYSPLPHQERFHTLPSNNRWMIGGNRMGKSYAITHGEIRSFALCDHPYRDVPEAGDVWACCQSTEVTLRHQLPMVRKAVGDANIRRIVYKPVPLIELTNGRTIVFKNYEQSAQKYAGQDPVLIAFDEEPPWDIVEECYARRSAHHELNIVGAVTPVKGLTWLFDKVVNNQWPEAMFVGGSVADNVYISKSERDALDKGLTGVMRKIRFLGEILPIGGGMVFDPEKVSRMLRRVREPLASFERENGRWIQIDDGPLRLYGDELEGSGLRFPWDWLKEGVRFQYVIGCDTAEGLNTSHSDAEPEFDETSIHVKNRHTRKVVAEYTSGIVEPDFVGEQVLPSLSDIFNGAKVNIERNNHGHTTIAFFKRRYPNRLYIPPENRTDRAFSLHERYGHLETDENRKYLINLLRKSVRSDFDYEIPSVKAVRQMLTFVRKNNGRMEHQTGCKDDCVFSLGLCEVLDMDSPRPAPLRIISKERERLRAIAAEQEAQRAVDWYRRI